jgi:alanyl-tRNA synthetase
VAVLGAALADGKGALLAVATDDVRERGLRADAIVREVAATVGGRGGGKPHMAQAGVEVAQLDIALAAANEIVSRVAGAK